MENHYLLDSTMVVFSERMEQSVRCVGLVALCFISLLWDVAVPTPSTRDITSTCYVARSSAKSGFHREVTTELTLSRDTVENHPHTQHVRYFIKEHIPTGLYVDLYQTKSMQEFGGPQVYSDTDIDLEAPEYNSPAHTVHVMSTMSHTSLYGSVMLPIHLRYHKPSSEDRHARIHLQPPEIYIIQPAGTPQNSSHVYETAVCDTTTDDLCTWRKLSCVFKDADGALDFEVPVGRADNVTIVTVVTISVTMVATLCLVYSMVTKRKQPLKTE